MTPLHALHQPLPREAVGFIEALGLPTRESYLGATSFEEQLYVEWLASRLDFSRGQVVDFGSWLGSFARSAARGLLSNPTATPRMPHDLRIHAYDAFKWLKSFDAWVSDLPGAAGMKPGDDFQPLFREWVGAYAPYIDSHAADLEVEPWTGQPIALLINDVWKSIAIADHTVHSFMPCLLPGAMLVNQDYLWHTESFIQVFMHRLRDYFEPVYQVPNGTTVSFACKQAVPADLPHVSDFGDFTREEVEAAFAWSATFLDEVGQAILPMAKAWCLWKMGLEAEASASAREVYRSPQLSHGFVQWQLETFKRLRYGYLLG
ncbi:MAG: hypothetical protein Q7P63_04915 [Verrucomicrobiota bacterium JB022]|nr:hypothetical protein [Verrucomicrobiota bacterium JB022]